jgi:hypothetical protein
MGFEGSSVIRIAFCNDCDRLQWNDYLTIHEFLSGVGLPAGDSFWLFDPMGLSDFSLFRNDADTPARNHDQVLRLIKKGALDVLHGIGHFGATPPGYVYPDREQIRRAFDYLRVNDCHVRIYTCHGNIKHVHNIPKHPRERRYQCGDLPFSQHYILDIAREYGIEFFWNSDLRQDLNCPFRTCKTSPTPDGGSIRTFTRFGQWGCGAHTIPENISRTVLEAAGQFKQSLVLFSHWGMPGLHSPTPEAPLLSSEVKEAFRALASMHQEGALEVVSLFELLDHESRKDLCSEADRILQLHPGLQGSQAPPASDYAELARQVGLRGNLVLDATGSRGRFGVHLTQMFDKVLCVERNDEDVQAGELLADSLNLRDIRFSSGPLSAHGLDRESLDALFCLSSETNEELLLESHVLLQAGKPLCVIIDDQASPARLQEMSIEAKFRTFEQQGPRETPEGFLGGHGRFFAVK